MSSTVAINTENISDEDILRANMYSFIANLIRVEPTSNLIDSIKQLTGDDSKIGKSIKLLKIMSTKLSLSEIQDEYVNLFIGVGRGELLPYSSYYITGFLNDKPLSNLREDMGLIGIRRKENVKDPEDHVSSIFDMMSGLIKGEFGKYYTINEQANFFNKHLDRWIDLLMDDIEKAKTAVFYAPIGTLGKEFIRIEREAFKMSVTG